MKILTEKAGRCWIATFARFAPSFVRRGGLKILTETSHVSFIIKSPSVCQPKRKREGDLEGVFVTG